MGNAMLYKYSPKFATWKQKLCKRGCSPTRLIFKSAQCKLGPLPAQPTVYLLSQCHTQRHPYPNDELCKMSGITHPTLSSKSINFLNSKGSLVL